MTQAFMEQPPLYPKTDAPGQPTRPVLKAVGFAAFVITMIGCAPNPATPLQVTPTLEPTFGPETTPQLLITAAPGKILFSDDFNSNVNGWQLDSVQSHWLTWTFNEGQLQVNRTRTDIPFSGLMHFFLPLPHQTFTDFQVSLAGRSTANVSSIGYGIFVDRPNADARYYFEIDTDGLYSIAQESQPPGQPHYLQEPASLATLKPSETNQLTVKAVGSTLAFSVNGTEVATVKNIPAGPGPVGLFVELIPGSDDRTSIEFDNLIVQLPQA